MSQLQVISINMTEYIPLTDDIKLIMAEAGKHSILKRKTFSLLWALKYAPADGVIAEFGAYKGGNGILFSKMRPKQHVHLLDTWTGQPDNITEKLDTKKPGDWGDVKFEDMLNLFKDSSNVTLTKGEFKDTLPHFEDVKFSLVFVDADVYQSTSEVLKFVKPRMILGGIIVIDDYNQMDCRGVKKAVNEEFEIDELLLLQNGSMVAWQNLNPAEDQDGNPTQNKSDTFSEK